VGTSLYLAPERALGRPAGPASHQHLDATPMPPRQLGAGLPPAFENYLLGLLAKDPEDRPTAQQVANWFRCGAWRGPAEPLPRELPDQGRGAAPATAPGPYVTGLGGPVPDAWVQGTSVPPVSVPAADREWTTTVHRAASHPRAARRSRPLPRPAGPAWRSSPHSIAAPASTARARSASLSLCRPEIRMTSHRKGGSAGRQPATRQKSHSAGARAVLLLRATAPQPGLRLKHRLGIDCAARVCLLGSGPDGLVAVHAGVSGVHLLPVRALCSAAPSTGPDSG
jgi:hypothetical protein